MSSRDNLAQPNQTKPWHGITPGANFADGGAVDDDVAGAIPDDGPHPPISGDDQPGAQPQQQGAIPDMGPAPTTGLGDYLGQQMQEGVRNAANTGPVRAAARVGALMNPGSGEDPSGGNSQSIMKYLIGGTAGGGADPETAEKFARPDKHKGANDSDANLLAVQKAFEMGGADAAWQMVQFNRGAYNAKAAYAKKAFEGVEGKAPDIAAGADAATKASAHMLDGSHIHFAPSAEDSIIALMKLPGSSQTQQIELDPKQLAQAIDPAGDGQYDKVIEGGGLPVMLQRINKMHAQRDADDAAAEKRISGSEKADADYQAAHPGGKGAFDKDGHYLGPQPDADPGNFGKELNRRADMVFTPGSVGDTKARAQWMQDQEDKELDREQKTDTAAVGASGRIGSADIGGVHKENVQTTKTDSNNDIEASRHADRQAKLDFLQQQLTANTATKEERNALQGLVAKLQNNKPWDDDDQKMYQGIRGRGQAAANRPPTGVPQAAQAPTTVNIPPPAQRIIGKTYTSPTGNTGVWTGKGWQVQ